MRKCWSISLALHVYRTATSYMTLLELSMTARLQLVSRWIHPWFLRCSACPIVLVICSKDHTIRWSTSQLLSRVCSLSVSGGTLECGAVLHTMHSSCPICIYSLQAPVGASATSEMLLRHVNRLGIWTPRRPNPGIPRFYIPDKKSRWPI